MNIDTLEKDYKKLKDKAKASINKEDYETACHYIQCAGKLSWRACISFTDDELEEQVKSISIGLLGNPINYDEMLKSPKSPKSILIIDTVCSDERSLAGIYIDALADMGYTIVYIFPCRKKKKITNTIQFLKEHRMKMISFDDSSIVTSIMSISKILRDYQQNKAIVNCGDADVIPASVLFHYQGIKSYRISYGDHTFNLGSSIYTCNLEFRDVGVYIAREYRHKSPDCIYKLPIYPGKLAIFKYEGLPIKLANKKLVVSGGQIYKTVDKENTYYRVIREILNKHTDCIFLMLSNGTTKELEKLIKEYPERVYHLRERRDLGEILKLSTLYVSTYPITGGRMIQYAADNHKVPISLMKDIKLDGGFLKRESELNVFFEDVSEFLNEIDRLLDDDNYRKEQEKKLEGRIIEKNEFDSLLNLVLSGKSKGDEISECTVSIEQAQRYVRSTLSGMEQFTPYLGAHPMDDCIYNIKVFPMKSMIAIIYKGLEKVKYIMTGFVNDRVTKF